MQKLIFATAAALALASPSLAADAHATGNLPIRSGPGEFYRVIGTLPDGARVGLSTCTRQQRWCKIIYDDGPNGWVAGSYLVGSAAKNRASPPEFTGGFMTFGFR